MITWDASENKPNNKRIPWRNLLSIYDHNGQKMVNTNPIDRDCVYIWISIVIVLIGIYYGLYKLIF